MVEVKIRGILAKITGYKWSSENEILERRLNEDLDPYGPSPSDPDSNLTEANKVIEKYGGQIVKHIPKKQRKGQIH